MIDFSNDLTFSNNTKLNLHLWIDSRSTERSCGLKAKVSITEEQWPCGCSSISLKLDVVVAGIDQNSVKHSIEGAESSDTFEINRSCCNSPQIVTLPDVVTHWTITHELEDSYLLFTVTAKVTCGSCDQLPIQMSDTEEGFVNIDLMPQDI